MEKVFIYIDDELDVCKIFEYFFGETENYKIKTFTDPKIAIDFIKENSEKIPCIFTDFKMPTMNGIDVAEQVSKFAPVYLVTGNSFGLPESEHISGVLSKPVKPSELEEIIKKNS
jgi:two-component SAPR family response regulator